MSHHISPSGAIEFCPVIQMATDFLNADGSNLTECYVQSQFLADMRLQIAHATRGCIIMEAPQLMTQMLLKHEVQDTTTRGTVMKEYANMTGLASHNMNTNPIPEQSRPYRWLKRHYFFGFGAYG